MAVAASSTALGEDALKCISHSSNSFAFVRLISRSNPLSFATDTMSAFFILLSTDFDGISDDSLTEISALFILSDDSEPPNSLEKNPFFLFSLLSLIIFA